jgi:hypothetical protein
VPRIVTPGLPRSVSFRPELEKTRFFAVSQAKDSGTGFATGIGEWCAELWQAIHARDSARIEFNMKMGFREAASCLS